MSLASAWYNPDAARRSSELQFRYANASGTYTAVGSIRNAITGQLEYGSRPIPLGTFIVPNWGRAYEGFHTFERLTDMQFMRPIHLPYPSQSPGSNYKIATRLPILVQGVEELLMWTCTGSITPRELKLLHAVYATCPEAAHGKLRVYVLRASRQFTVIVPSPQGGMTTKACTAPVWEPADWMDYNEEIFGMREVPPPSLQVGVAPAAPMLSQNTPAATEVLPQAAPNGNATEQPADPIETSKVDPFKNIASRSVGKKESPPF
jgi:hypothetical protein